MLARMATTRTPRRADIDSFYTCQHPDEFPNWRAFYESAEQRTARVRDRWRHELDVPYGPHLKQRLDLYVPGTVSAPPVLLFVHGGGFREGDPTLYGFLAEPFLERGIAFASVGYRLTPETYLPSTVNDVEDALAWCSANLAERGIDPGRIVLAGHSAGAILTAHVSMRQDWLAQRGLPPDLIKAAAPISGMYDFRAGADYVADPSQLGAASPLLNVSAPVAHTLIAYGSLERSPQFGTDSEALVAAIRATGRTAELLRLEGLDHRQTVDCLSDPSSELFQAVERLIALAAA
jgi:arylformamidase